eukprot:GHUV01030195.1.p1 GENE.GHUV01030195.1~~GHUV01030195.1.p1  ORF type:complete len:340 (+),score=113.06 GHUV01030195.1:602-1621(+)
MAARHAAAASDLACYVEDVTCADCHHIWWQHVDTIAQASATWLLLPSQTATIYKENGHLLPKEYSFKIQHVRGSESTAVRKTVGKIKVDMTKFCSEDPAPVPQEVFLQLKPAGKLKVSIKGTWLKDAKIDMDALTEASFTTHKSGDGLERADEDEQDLTGFDYLNEGVQQQQQHHKPHSQLGSTAHSAGSPRAAAGSGDGSTTSGASAAARVAAKYGHSDGSQTSGSPRIGAVGGSHLKSSIPGAIPAFDAGLSPAQEEEQERARQAALKQAEMDKMRRTLEDQLRRELNDALAVHNKTTWRDYLCCCFPRKVRVRTDTELAIRDESEKKLLASQGDYL